MKKMIIALILTLVFAESVFAYEAKIYGPPANRYNGMPTNTGVVKPRSFAFPNQQPCQNDNYFRGWSSNPRNTNPYTPHWR